MIGEISHSNQEQWKGDPSDGGGSCIISYTKEGGMVLTWSGDSVIIDSSVKLANDWSKASREIQQINTMYYNYTYGNEAQKTKYDTLKTDIISKVGANVTYYTVNTNNSGGYYRIRYTEDEFEWDSSYTQKNNVKLTTFTDVYFDIQTNEVIKIMKAKDGANFEFGKTGANGELTGFWTDERKMEMVYQKP